MRRISKTEHLIIRHARCHGSLLCEPIVASHDFETLQR